MHRPRLQSWLYRVFLLSCMTATGLGLLVIWGVEPTRLLGRVLGSSLVIAVASALTISANRLMAAPPGEADRA